MPTRRLFYHAALAAKTKIDMRYDGRRATPAGEAAPARHRAFRRTMIMPVVYFFSTYSLHANEHHVKALTAAAVTSGILRHYQFMIMPLADADDDLT